VKFERVRRALAQQQGVVVACSGGCDSMLLSELAREACGTRLRLVHVNHHLRPDAVRDEALVRRWAAQHALPLQVVHLEPATLRAHRAGLEAAARAARYRALLEHTPAGWTLATGHHANDRLETLLLRLQQGTGLGGLAGPRHRMRRGSHPLIRPMLHLWRDEVEAEAALRALPFANDPSNSDLSFDRNRLRHAVIRPWLEEASTGPLARSLALVSEERRLLHQLLAARLDEVMQPAAGGWKLPRATLASSPAPLAAALLREALRRSPFGRPSAAFVRSVVARAARPGAFELHGEGLTIQASRDWIEWSSPEQSA
jgi:tRNA(Ile)-lysidine synthase